MIAVSGNNFFKVNYIQILLICLFPASIIAGPLIAEIIMNLTNILFFYTIIKKGNYSIFKNRVLLYFFLFYIYINITTLIYIEDYKILVNTFSYVRFIIFGFAFFHILKNNTKAIRYVYFSLSITLFCLIFDGYFEYFSGHNLFGLESIRPDRLSGFFFEDLVLGSFLSRTLFLYLALIFFFKEEKKKLFYINLVIFTFGYFLVFLSGERAAFIIISLLLFIFIFFYFSFKKIIYIFLIFLISFGFIFKSNPILSDRYYNQLKYHFLGNKSKEVGFLPNYLPMFSTAYKMFKSKPITGYGVKSFRYYCDQDEFLTLSNTNKYPIYYFKIKIPNLGKKDDYLIVEKTFFEVGDKIKKGDVLFTYKLSDERVRYFKSRLSGTIKNISPKKKLFENDEYLNLENLNNSKEFKYQYESGCNIHPHQIYIQLLAEVGIIGFAFIFYIFLKISFYLIKYFYFLKIKKKTIFSLFSVCIYLSIFGNLWPLTTSGNFFNNFMNFLFYYPLGFYLFALSDNEKMKFSVKGNEFK